MKNITIISLILINLKSFSAPIVLSKSNITSINLKSGESLHSYDQKNIKSFIKNHTVYKKINFGKLETKINTKEIQEINLLNGDSLNIEKINARAGGDMGGGGSEVIITD